MKSGALMLILAGTLVGCSGKPNRVEATVVGDAGKYKGFPVCVEITYQNTESLGVYPKDLCSAQNVEGPFQVTLSGQADDPENDVYNASGNVYLRANSTAMPGNVTSRSEETEGDTMKLSFTVAF